MRLTFFTLMAYRMCDVTGTAISGVFVGGQFVISQAGWTAIKRLSNKSFADLSLPELATYILIRHVTLAAYFTHNNNAITGRFESEKCTLDLLARHTSTQRDNPGLRQGYLVGVGKEIRTPDLLNAMDCDGA